MAIAETARLIASLELDPRKFNRGADQAIGKLGRLEGSLGRMGRGAGQLGSGLLRSGLLVGGAVITGISAAAKASIDFESAFAGVKKTVNEADLKAVGLSFDSLSRSFRDMATEMPIAATEIARIGETAGALGIKAKDIEAFTRTVSLLGVTTNLTSDAAAESMGKLGTILGLTGDDYKEFADALVNLGNKGASTETEILETAKRFAGVGRQAGLTKEEILALSSAITSLGAEPEAGGSALSRIFSNMGTEIANATKKGEAFSDLTGDSLKELAKRINKGDSLGIFRDTIKGLAKLKTTTEKYKFLKALGITNVRDRDAIIKVANDIGVLDDSLKNAADSAGALDKEASTRFATLASKLTVLKNNAIEAAITFGEGLTPAVGRAADKLTAFLKDPVNKGQLKALGEDIGAAIDKIEWDKVLEGAKTFVGILKDAGGFALGILETLNKLPTEIKTAGLGLLGLNKLSGGLIGAGLGNIFGGLGEVFAKSVGSHLPGLAGKLFVQPVFVTNMGAGGMGTPGGVVPGGKGGSLLGAVTKVFIAGMAAGLAVELWGQREQQSAENKEEVRALGSQTGAFTNSASLDEMKASLAGIEAYEEQLAGSLTPEGLAYALNIDGVADAINDTEAQLSARIAKLEGAAYAVGHRADERADNTAAKVAAATSAINAAKVAQISAIDRDRSAIVTAIKNNKPVVNLRVNVSNTSKVRVYQTGGTINRSGSGSGPGGPVSEDRL